tara:strand:+ start:918 stop:1892 length:975 start_codon:yes stop_codon:yes gene_type:complete
LKKYLVRQYESKDYQDWNAFIGKAKNATFLFNRDFMEYHKERFDDFSLLIFDDKKLVAVLPANRVGAIVHSHQGLSYGGLIYCEQLSQTAVLAIFKEVMLFLNRLDIQIVNLKIIPSIYHHKPAEELLYALFLVEAKLTRRDVLSVIDLSNAGTYSKIRKRGIKKAVSKDLMIKEEVDFDGFWNEILIPNLKLRHNIVPVHSLEEISRLKLLFPNNIRQFNVYDAGEIVGGTTIFESEKVAHCQYVSKFGSEETGSLDFLFDYLLQKEFAGKRYFDFGISNVDQGKKLNEGLTYWKESFGASTIVQDFYELETANYYKLESPII